MDPKSSLFGEPKSSKTICFHGVFAQNGPPKGARKRAKIGTKTSQNWVHFGAKMEHFGVKIHPNRSLLEIWPKWGVRKPLESLRENFLVMRAKKGLRNFFKKLSSPGGYLPAGRFSRTG